jgi:HK97 family phage portal protein
MSDKLSFWDLLRGKMTPEQQQKALSISLAPNGFVNEIQTMIVRGGATSYGADTAALEATMAQNELVYACIHIKATSARDPRLTVQQQTTSGGKTTYEEIPGHPFRQLLMHPNALMTEGDLMQAAIVSWDVSNPRRFYAEKVYQNKLLTELHPLNPACMTPLLSRDRRDVIGYTWKDGQNKRDYSLDELLIRAAPAWYNPPPLIAALGSVGADTAQTQTIGQYFQNGGIPPLFLKYSMALNDTQRDDIRAKWRAIYGGGQASGDIGVLDVNSDVREVGSKLDQLASQTLRSVSESRICMVFGVPPLIVYAYVGLLRATYSNLKEAWAGFWDATMSPAFKEWRDWYTWALLPEFEDMAAIRSETVKLAYDMTTVAALQDDVDAIQARARANFQAQIISQNEARSALGYDAIDGGDEAYYHQIPAAAPAAAGAAAGKSRKTRETKVTRQAIERRMEKTVARYLQGEYDAAARAVE